MTGDLVQGGLRMTTAAEWTCANCNDTGYARTLADAAEALGEHQEDFH